MRGRLYSTTTARVRPATRLARPRVFAACFAARTLTSSTGTPISEAAISARWPGSAARLSAAIKASSIVGVSRRTRRTPHLVFQVADMDPVHSLRRQTSRIVAPQQSGSGLNIFVRRLFPGTQVGGAGGLRKASALVVIAGLPSPEIGVNSRDGLDRRRARRNDRPNGQESTWPFSESNGVLPMTIVANPPAGSDIRPGRLDGG